MPNLYRERWSETVGLFLARTEPTTHREALMDEIRQTRRSLVEKSQTPPRKDILLAQKLAQVGSDYLRTAEASHGNVMLFPGGCGLQPSGEYKSLDVSEQRNINYAYAAVMLGVTIEFLYEMLTEQTIAESVFFNRKDFFQKFLGALQGVNFPHSISIDRLLQPAPSATLDQETHSEKLISYSTKKLRAYVAEHGTYDFLSTEHHLDLPTSLLSFLLFNQTLGHIITNFSRRENPERPTLVEEYHARALALLKEDEVDLSVFQDTPFDTSLDPDFLEAGDGPDDSSENNQ